MFPALVAEVVAIFRSKYTNKYITKMNFAKEIQTTALSNNTFRTAYAILSALCRLEIFFEHTIKEAHYLRRNVLFLNTALVQQNDSDIKEFSNARIASETIDYSIALMEKIFIEGM